MVRGLLVVWALSLVASAGAGYVNFEVAHVHPIDLTPSGGRLLAVNTPDALLEVFDVLPGGDLVSSLAIPVGLEPVTVVARSDAEAWVVNQLSDSVSVVDLVQGVVSRTLTVGDEPTDVAFAGGKAFVSVSSEDAVKVFDLADLDAAPAVIPLFGRDVRALAASNDGLKVYAVVLASGNRTTVLPVELTFAGEGLGFDEDRLDELGLRTLECVGGIPSYPPLPAGITRNPALTDPGDGVPKVGLIVKWNEVAGQWQDENATDWSDCLPYRLADDDLFVIDVGTHGVTAVKQLGTSLFDVSVHPTNGKIYVPNTDARNEIRFEHALGVQGHTVDNRLSVVDPSNANAVTLIDLNAHINRASDPAANLVERQASISQPGMMAWRSDGSAAYLTAIGSRKLFRVAGSCLSDACVFGANRAVPDAVDVGEGPTGVALLERPNPADDRLYVLNRISHSIAVVQASTLSKLGELNLHDPSSAATKAGRRFLYDGIDTSGHGDAACSSCHLSGDTDGLAWDLGDPEGGFQDYAATDDNVRFIVPTPSGPIECPPSLCASHDGFDPQKGPMTTQTLRAMLEPLHWRGDRATMLAFNKAFVGLMGTEDIGPINGEPAGLSAADMSAYRQFTLEIALPPNPHRNVDDTMPCGLRAVDPGCEVNLHGALLPGNPTEGERIFLDDASDAGSPCVACHTLPHGAGGGTLGGVTPTNPTSSTAAALFNGDADGSPHSDLKVPHLRNMYEKFGPILPAPGDGSTPETINGFGYIHDGGIPDLYRFLSATVFNLSPTNDPAEEATKVRDLVSFMFSFPTGTRPAVGRQVTLPAGTPPTGSPAAEALWGTLLTLGDLSDSSRHCELTASAFVGGRIRRYHLSGGSFVPDLAVDAPLTPTALREVAQSAITFTCGTLGSGPRLGGDRDEDLTLDGDDCAPGDPTTQAAAATIDDLALREVPFGTRLTWSDQSGASGPSLRYDVLGGALSDLAGSGLALTGCIGTELEAATYLDAGADPTPGQGVYYLVRASNPCGVADLGSGRESLASLVCP